MGEVEESGERDSRGGKKYFCWTKGDHLDMSCDEEDVEVFCHGISVDVDFMGDIADSHSFGVVF